MLCVGALRPHKNQALLGRSLAALPEDVHVVCAGRSGPYADEVRATARAAEVGPRLHITDYVSDDELEALWRIADAFVLPTRAEGFGLPVLEAMSRGVPVACSDLEVLREVGGGCAAYFDPDDAGEAARAITAALAGGTLADCGPAHAATFSWEATAEATLEVYDRVLSARGTKRRSQPGFE